MSLGILRQVPNLPCPTAMLLLSFHRDCLSSLGDCLNLSSKRYTCPAATTYTSCTQNAHNRKGTYSRSTQHTQKDRKPTAHLDAMADLPIVMVQQQVIV